MPIVLNIEKPELKPINKSGDEVMRSNNNFFLFILFKSILLKSDMKRNFHILLAIAMFGVIFLSSTAYAQNAEVEPNQPCSKAQDLGAISLPFTQAGSLDSTNEQSDVDFFKFTGTPGEFVAVDLEGAPTGKGTLGDPLLGYFDSSCNLITTNDDNAGTTNSRLQLPVPADGIIILAATYCCDREFQGGGTGTYQMTISPFIPNVSISGQVVDALFGDPLQGGVEPFASVELDRCDNSGCYPINYQPADSEGRFRFSSDSSGFPLVGGKYQIVVNANQYQSGRTDPITVREGEDQNVGNVLLEPFPVQFSDVVPCDNLPSEGGICRYSVKVTNHLSTPFYGRAWSLISASTINSFAGTTNFQVNAVPLKLKSHKGTNLQFEFRIPAGALVDGSWICASIYVGQNPHAQFNTVGNRDLFCFSKAESEFKIMPEKNTQEMFRQLNGKTAQHTAANTKQVLISQ